ncbi:MAG: hypothetical protein ABIK66_06180, partial [candidate division WOR-3 bacterium]
YESNLFRNASLYETDIILIGISESKIKMKEKIKTILIGVLIGIIAFPTLTLGGTFVVSLIQGKSVEEAIQILAEQIDALIGRVEILEVKQSKTELWQKKEEACRLANELNHSIPPRPPGVAVIDGIYLTCKQAPNARPGHMAGVSSDTIEGLYNWVKDCLDNPDFEVIKPAYEKYFKAKQECDELTAQYNSLSQ